MGQQQLLLIVLGVILVGVAVVLGIQYFGVGAKEGAKDELVAHNLILVPMLRNGLKNLFLWEVVEVILQLIIPQLPILRPTLIAS